MNGPVNTVQLDARLTWEQFSKLSESLRREYIQNILAHYNVGPNAIARMFGISGPYCGKRLRELGFTFNKRADAKETRRFLDAYGVSEKKEMPASFDRISVTFSGVFSPELLAQRLSTLFESGRRAVVTVEITAE